MALRLNQVGQWQAISDLDAPSARSHPAVISAGDAIFIWGGVRYDSRGNAFELSTGALYHPDTDSWQPITPRDAPLARQGHMMAWTGDKVFVWGGVNRLHCLNTGGLYDPKTDRWQSISSEGAPKARAYATAHPIGNGDVLVWGGVFCDPKLVAWESSGAIYNSLTNSWRKIDAPSPPHAASNIHWVGGLLVAWQWDTGGRYEVTTNRWLPLSLTGAPARISPLESVTVGEEILFWAKKRVGALYHPGTDTWRPVGTANAPSPRTGAVFLGNNEFAIEFGGTTSSPLPARDGGVYDRENNLWTPIPVLPGAPSPRIGAGAIFHDGRLYVWGGMTEVKKPFGNVPVALGDGAALRIRRVTH